MLLQSQFEASVLGLDIQPAAGKSVFDGVGECVVTAQLENGLESGRQIAPLMMQYRSEGTDVSSACSGSTSCWVASC